HVPSRKIRLPSMPTPVRRLFLHGLAWRILPQHNTIAASELEVSSGTQRSPLVAAPLSKNSYRARVVSGLACVSRSRCMTAPVLSYLGHCGRPRPLGSPVFAKFVQYPIISSVSFRSSGRHND